jgi:hypothetical protein
MACDCQSALLNIFERNFDNAAQAHYDIIHASRHLCTQSPIQQWTARHVYGHQDDDKAYAELGRWEQINVDMDALAKLHWITVQNNHRPHFDLPHHSAEWSIWHRGKRLPRWSEKLALTLMHTTPSQQEYWYQRQ